jgi:hypothetical protein
MSFACCSAPVSFRHFSVVRDAIIAQKTSLVAAIALPHWCRRGYRADGTAAGIIMRPSAIFWVLHSFLAQRLPLRRMSAKTFTVTGGATLVSDYRFPRHFDRQGFRGQGIANRPRSRDLCHGLGIVG